MCTTHKEIHRLETEDRNVSPEKPETNVEDVKFRLECLSEASALRRGRTGESLFLKTALFLEVGTEVL